MFPGHLGESRDSRTKVKCAVLLLAALAAPLQAEPSVLSDPPPSLAGLSWRDITQGNGTEVSDGKLVTVYYSGSFANSHVFDNRYAKAPFTFVQGVTRLLPGWRLGVAGMRPGGRRIVTIPPALAYGAEGVLGFIPREATLIYQIEVASVQ